MSDDKENKNELKDFPSREDYYLSLNVEQLQHMVSYFKSELLLISIIKILLEAKSGIVDLSLFQTIRDTKLIEKIKSELFIISNLSDPNVINKRINSLFKEVVEAGVI